MLLCVVKLGETTPRPDVHGSLHFRSCKASQPPRDRRPCWSAGSEARPPCRSSGSDKAVKSRTLQTSGSYRKVRRGARATAPRSDQALLSSSRRTRKGLVTEMHGFLPSSLPPSLPPSLPSFLCILFVLIFNLIFILYWKIVDLQCCVSFRCTAR